MKHSIFTIVVCLVFSFAVRAQTAEEWLAKCQKNFNQKRYLSAVRDCEASIKLKPANNPQAYYAKAIAHKLRRENWDGIAAISKALESFPNDEKGFGQRGEMFLEIWDLDAALADFNKVLQINPNSTAALFRRSEVYKLQRKNDLAIVDLKKLQTLLPNEAAVRKSLQQLQSVASQFSYEAKGLLSDLKTDMSADAGFAAYKTNAEKLKKPLVTEKDYEEVSRFLYRSLDEKNELQKYFKPRTEAQTRTFDYVQVLSNCLARFPENYACNVFNHAQYVPYKDKYDNYRNSNLEKWTIENLIPISTLLITKTDATKKDYIRSLYSQRGTNYYFKKNYPKALADFEKAVQLSTPKSLIHDLKDRYLAYKGLGKYDLALADLNKALELKAAGQTAAGVISERSRIELLNEMNKPAQAIAEADKLLQNLPQFTSEWQVNLQKAVAYRLQNKNDVALAEIDRIVEKYPNAMNVKSERALIYRALGKLDLAYADEYAYEQEWETVK